MNIAIVDDNGIFIESFKSIIAQVCAKNNIDCKTEVFYDGLSVLENYEKFHLIFLDIEMPVLNGLETAEKLNGLKGSNDFPFVVFVTCNDSLVFKALKKYPYSFIRKSELCEDTEACILKIAEKLKSNRTRYCIKTGRKNIFINLEDVFYLEKVKNYIHYHTSAEVFKERCTMDEKEAELADAGFIRTHIGYMANAVHITEISTNEIILDNSVRIPVSKRYKPELKEKYYKWLVNMYD